MDRVDLIMNASVRTLVNRTIEALLSGGAIEERLSETYECISVLERDKNEIPDELLNELKQTARNLEGKSGQRAGDCLSSEAERELTERLLSLYIDISDGALIF